MAAAVWPAVWAAVMVGRASGVCVVGDNSADLTDFKPGFDTYETAAVQWVPIGFADEIEIQADGRLVRLVFDGARSDLMAEARELVARLGIDSGAGCLRGRDCAAEVLMQSMKAPRLLSLSR